MTYYHWAAEPVNLQRMTYPQMGHPKPNGLWFDVDGSWRQWCEAVQFRQEDLFRDILGQFTNYIMLGEVAGKYSGIIIDPYFPERRDTYLWYYGWNCAGGCIWETSVIRLSKLYLEESHP